MSKIKVMCTSTGCIEYAPKKYMEEHDIDIIRIKVLFKGKEMLEGLDLNPDEFYSELETLQDVKNNLPRTAMPTVEEVKAVLSKAEGVVVQDDNANKVYPMPLTAENKNEVFVGRIRKDDTVENGINLWCVADNIRKGAATNAVQIAQKAIELGAVKNQL